MKVSELASIELVPFVLDAYKKQAKTKNTTADTQNTAAREKEQKAKQSNDNAPKQTNNTPTKTIRVNIERLDILMNLFEELVIDRGRLEQISSELNNSELQDTVERMS